MKRLAIAAFALAVSTGLPAVAKSPFDGTWRSDPASVTWSGKPSVYLLKDGLFQCPTCGGGYQVLADGAPHAVGAPADGYAVSLKVLGEREVRLTTFKRGAQTSVRTVTVAPGGGALASGRVKTMIERKL